MVNSKTFYRYGFAIPVVLVVLLIMGLIVLSLGFFSNTNVALESRYAVTVELTNCAELLALAIVDNILKSSSADPSSLSPDSGKTASGIQYLAFVNKKYGTVAEFDSYVICAKKGVKLVLATHMEFLNVRERRLYVFFDDNKGISKSDPDLQESITAFEGVVSAL